MPLLELATEAEFQKLVVEYAHQMGWKVHHTRPARTDKGWRTPIQGDPGFPDLVLVRGDYVNGRVVFAELKSQKGRIISEQQGWLNALYATCSVEVYEWRPSDWPTIQEVLR